MSSNPDNHNCRRDFLRTCGCALAALAVAPLAGGCEFSRAIGGSSDVRLKTIVIDVSTLTKDGDALMSEEKATDKFPVMVIRRSEGVFTTLSSLCPHSGNRRVDRPVDNIIECPGHLSHFNLDGRVLDGIAMSFGNLRSYENTYDTDTQRLTVRA